MTQIEIKIILLNLRNSNCNDLLGLNKKIIVETIAIYIVRFIYLKEFTNLIYLQLYSLIYIQLKSNLS